MMTHWTIDPGHSQVNFSVRHMMISTMRGMFTRFGGTFRFDPDQLGEATVDVTIETSSIYTGLDKRDDHLRLEDFFAVQKFPTMSFTSRKVQEVDAERFDLMGDLTIKGVSKEITLEVSRSKPQKSPAGQIHMGFHATATINRDDWGMNWNVALETGGWLIGKDIKLELDLELIREESSSPSRHGIGLAETAQTSG